MNRNQVLIAMLITLTAVAMADDTDSQHTVMSAALPLAPGHFVWQVALSGEDGFPSLGGATAWLNSQALTSASLRGKVVLVEFWTYSCINWRREYPYVRAWAEKYRDKGLVVIGVHSPEFTFEKDLKNVRIAVNDIGITYPVAVDSRQAIWKSFENSYWPALYLIDGLGHVRYHHFGEGDYEQSERFIQRLLSETGSGGANHELVKSPGSGMEAPADWKDLRSPENYLGLSRTSGLLSTSPQANKRNNYEVPARLRLNEWAPVGNWTLKDESASLNEREGSILYNFHARDLYVVMGSANSGVPARFRVLIDGLPPGVDRGGDVDEQGLGIVNEPRLYQLIRQRGPIIDRRFQIEFLEPGVEVYSFTFG